MLLLPNLPRAASSPASCFPAHDWRAVSSCYYEDVLEPFELPGGARQSQPHGQGASWLGRARAVDDGAQQPARPDPHTPPSLASSLLARCQQLARPPLSHGSAPLVAATPASSSSSSSLAPPPPASQPPRTSPAGSSSSPPAAPASQPAMNSLNSLIPFTTSGSLVDCVDSGS